MTKHDDSLRRDIALFRYGLIADLLILPAGSHEITTGLRDRAGRDHDIPGTSRTRVVELFVQHCVEFVRPRKHSKQIWGFGINLRQPHSIGWRSEANKRCHIPYVGWMRKGIGTKSSVIVTCQTPIHRFIPRSMN